MTRCAYLNDSASRMEKTTNAAARMMALPQCRGRNFFTAGAYAIRPKSAPTMPMASTLAVFSPLGGRSADKVGYRATIIAGMSLAALALVLVSPSNLTIPLVSIGSLVFLALLGMITKNAVDRGTAETALDIIKYFTNQANETQVSLVNKTIPANSAALNDPQIQALATIKGFGTALALGIPMANTPYAGAQWGPVGDATNAIWSGSQTPEEALAAAQTAMETAIAGMK